MTSRRTLAVTVALCAVLAACGQGQEQEQTANTAATSPVTATASPSPTTTSPETSEPTTDERTGQDTAPAGSATTDSSPQPSRTQSSPTSSPRADQQRAGGSVEQTTPGDYGDAAIAAWSAGDTETASRYIASSASADLGSSPQGELLRVACDGDMCSYTTEGGQRVTLTFDLAKVEAGQTGGIVAVKVD